MTNGNLARLDSLEHFLRENVGYQSEILIAADRLAVGECHSRADAPSVLHGIEREMGQLQHFLFIGTVNAENAALFA